MNTKTRIRALRSLIDDEIELGFNSKIIKEHKRQLRDVEKFLNEEEACRERLANLLR